MDSLWHRTITSLRDLFRAQSDQKAPVYQLLIERNLVPGVIHEDLPAGLLPHCKCSANYTIYNRRRLIAADYWGNQIPQDLPKIEAGPSRRVWATYNYQEQSDLLLECETDGQIDRYSALAEDTGRAIQNSPPEVVAFLPEMIRWLCVKPRSITRYRFGSIATEPPAPTLPITAIYDLGNEGCVVDLFDSPLFRGIDTWTKVLYRLASLRYPMPRLEAEQYCWGNGGGLKVSLKLKGSGPVSQMLENRRPPLNWNQWYSILGDKSPIDSFEASARAIDIILECASHAAVSSEVLSAPEKTIDTPIISATPAETTQQIMFGTNEIAKLLEISVEHAARVASKLDGRDKSSGVWKVPEVSVNAYLAKRQQRRTQQRQNSSSLQRWICGNGHTTQANSKPSKCSYSRCRDNDFLLEG